MLDDPFFTKWFKGVCRFLHEESEATSETFLTYCAESCSKSYSLAVYQNAFDQEKSVEESMTLLANSFADFAYEIRPECIEIRYSACGCELFTNELVRSKRLCRCSELSLAYNWESVFGKSNVRVERKASILFGNKECVFEVKVKQLGHSW